LQATLKIAAKIAISWEGLVNYMLINSLYFTDKSNKMQCCGPAAGEAE